MLPATQRLRRTGDIQHVYKAGRVASVPALRVFAVASKQPASRATVVVSTRVSKKATDRNRIKRRLRADLTSLLARQAAVHSETHDIVVLAQPQAATAAATQLTVALQGCFNRLHLT